MGTLRQVRLQSREPQMRQVPNAKHRLDEHILRALNKIKKPSTAEEIAELLNRDLGPGDQPFQVREVATWLHNARKTCSLCIGWEIAREGNVLSHSRRPGPDLKGYESRRMRHFAYFARMWCSRKE